MKQIFLAFIFFWTIFSPVFVYAQTTTAYDWATGVLDPDRSAGSATIRNHAGAQLANRFVYTYMTDDGKEVYFVTSTLGGEEWSLPQYVTSTSSEYEQMRELPSSIALSNQQIILLRDKNYSTAYGISFGPYAGAAASSTYTYTTLNHYGDVDITLHSLGGGQFGMSLFGMWPYAGVDFLQMASSTGNYTTDTFETMMLENKSEGDGFLMDAEYASVGVSTFVLFGYISGDDPTLYSYVGSTPFHSVDQKTSGLVSGGVGTPVALEAGRYGATGFSFILCGGTRGSTCDLYFAKYDPTEGVVEDAHIIFSGIPQSDNIKLGISSRAGGPVLVFFDGTDLRYAVREENGETGNGSCVGATTTDWSCGFVARDVGALSSLSVEGMRYTGVPSGLYEDQIIVAYADGTQTYFARGVATRVTATAASSQGSSFPRAVPPTNPRISVNNNTSITGNRVVPVVVTATDASYVALSTTPDFVNASWQEIAYPNYITLPDRAGEYTVYAKFTNMSGGVSDVVTAGISYYQAMVTQPSIDSSVKGDVSLNPKDESTKKIYTKNSESGFVPGYLLGIQPENTKPEITRSVPFACGIRPNAFTVGGTIIRDSDTKNLFVIDTERSVGCRVESAAVARSWGVTKFPQKSVTGIHIIGSLPYRPGTVVVDSKTGVRYFTNTRGELHKFPSLAHYRALGYGNQAFYYDTTKSIAAFTRSADLTRRDIHPDGTLFILNKKKGEYAILHNRTLHPLTAKSLGIYKDKTSRAIPLLKGETYPIGEEWNP